MVINFKISFDCTLDENDIGEACEIILCTIKSLPLLGSETQEQKVKE